MGDAGLYHQYLSWRTGVRIGYGCQLVNDLLVLFLILSGKRLTRYAGLALLQVTSELPIDP